jgi:TonB family protein
VKTRDYGLSVLALLALAGVTSIGKAQDEVNAARLAPPPPSLSERPLSRPAPKIPDTFKRPTTRAVLREGSILTADYPAAALRNAESGMSAVLAVVGKDGRPKSCESGGSTPNLDDAACRVVLQRFRFSPARNGRGRAVEDMWSKRIVWALPQN